VVNVAVLVLRNDPVGHTHFRTPSIMAVIGALSCAFLAGPWTGRDPIQYKIAGVLLGIGIALWVVTILVNRTMGAAAATDPDLEDALRTRGPVN
jgi:ABC-type sulfate transport system permease component